jgi:glycosyltransferase involved in cell wall biosynthesis
MAAYTNYRRDPRVKREAEALVDAGHQVVFLARRQPGEPNRETIAGVDVIKTIGFKSKCTSFAEYLIDYIVFFFMIFFHLLRHPYRYKLIHINNMPDFLVFAAVIPKLLGVPVIHDIHDLMPELYLEKFVTGEENWIVKVLTLQERWAGSFATAVITVEERLKDIISTRGIMREKIHVLMNLPDDRIFKLRKSQAPKTSDTKFVMVYHGTLARRLGLDVAIEAVARAKSEIPTIEFRIIGAGEERPQLITLRDKLNLQTSVTFSDGFVPVENIPSMINDADIGIIPLRICSGTDIMLPTKLLEYVAMGIPCITPKTGTIGRYFDDKMVRFFESEDIDSLADAIIDLYHNPEKRMSLALNSTEKFGQIYNWQNHKMTYVNLVNNLLSKNQSVVC